MSGNPWGATQTWRGGAFALERGGRLAGLNIAYATAGRLAADGRNAVLLTHGYTSSHRFAEPAPGAKAGWAQLVGPGRAVDTDRLFVVAPNMLGSCHGTTGPASTDPATGRPYGPHFPEFTVADMVRGQKLLLDALGVRHLIAVVGPSYGGFQAFQWAVTFPEFMTGIVAAVTGLRPPGGTVGTVAEITDWLSRDPNWNGGDCYPAGVKATMTALRVETLKLYGVEAMLAPAYPDPAAREAAILALAAAWADIFDPNSLIVLRRALDFYDVTPDIGRIRARVLYALSRTDALFPPALAEPTMAALHAAGVAAEYTLIDSDMGHDAAGDDALAWEPALRAFMAGLEGRA